MVNWFHVRTWHFIALPVIFALGTFSNVVKQEPGNESFKDATSNARQVIHVCRYKYLIKGGWGCGRFWARVGQWVGGVAGCYSKSVCVSDETREPQCDIMTLRAVCVAENLQSLQSILYNCIFFNCVIRWYLIQQLTIELSRTLYSNWIESANKV